MAKNSQKSKRKKNDKVKSRTSDDSKAIKIVGDGNVIGDHSSSQVTKLEYKNTSQKSPPSSSQKRSALLIFVGLVISTLIAITTDIIAAYLQDKLNIFTDNTRLAIVIVVFLVALVIAIWLTIKYGYSIN